MKRCLPLMIILLLFLTGCGRAVKLSAPTPAREAPLYAEARPISDDAGLRPQDLTGLAELLAAAEAQPCTAGNSLRMAALAGELLRWLGNNQTPDSVSELAAALLRSGPDPAARPAARRSLKLLLDAAQRMEEEQTLALLQDAGFEPELSAAQREEFCRLLEALLASLEPKIFKKGVNKMNISPDNHCRPGKSVL